MEGDNNSEIDIMPDVRFLNIGLGEDNDIMEGNNTSEIDIKPDVRLLGLREDNDPECIQIAGDEIPQIELELQEIDKMSIVGLLEEIVKVSSLECYCCKHAKYIFTNGKQLVFHILQKHRIINFLRSEFDDSVEDGGVEIVARLIDSVKHVINVCVKLKENDNKSNTCIFDMSYDCLNCDFKTDLYKDLFIHNVCVHNSTSKGYKCIMCCHIFGSYIHLLCHLCPGIYREGCAIMFRCFSCFASPIPQAEDLTLHLEQCHKGCLVCLEISKVEKTFNNTE